MSWFSKLFKLPKKQPNKSGNNYAAMMNGYIPVFSQFGNDIYASDVVQQAIHCIVSEMQKIDLAHVRYIGEEYIPIKGNVQSVLDNPNPLMVMSDFVGKVIWQLYFNYNSFILPSYEQWVDKKGITRRKFKALYPIQPKRVDFIEGASNAMYVCFAFGDGEEYTVKYENVIHLRYRYSVNEYMGGNEFGQPDNNVLLETLDINYQLLHGVGSAMKASYAVNGVVNYNSMMDDGKTTKALAELEKKLASSDSGFLPLDLKSSYTPIRKDVKLVDKDTLQFIDEKILRHFGVPLPILTGDYTKDQYDAFYQKTIEPLIKLISQVFTKGMFTPSQQAMGDRIVAYPEDLVFMNMEQKLKMIELFSPSGTLTENQKRIALGMRPSSDLIGKRMQSLNYIDTTIANEYQTNKTEVKPNESSGTKEI